MHRGFTLLEMAVTVAIIGVLSAIAIPVIRTARRNAIVTESAYGLSLWLDGLRARAMRDQRDLVAVVVDVPNNDATACAQGGDAQCAHYYLVRPDEPPAPNFVLNGFAPGAVANGAIVDEYQLGHGVRFNRLWDGAAPRRPFAGMRAFDPQLVGACGGGRACVGVRFRGTGEVRPEWPSGGVPPVPKTGVAFAVGSDLTERDATGTDQRLIVVSFPTGVVKSFPISTHP